MAKRDEHLIRLHKYFDETVSEGVADGHIGHFRLWRDILGDDCPEIVITETRCCPAYQPHKGYKESVSADTQLGELATLARFYHAHGIDAQVYDYSADPLWHSFSTLDAKNMHDAMTRVNAEWRAIVLPIVTVPPEVETPEPGTFRLTLT